MQNRNDHGRVERRTSFGIILRFFSILRSAVESTPLHQNHDINLRKLSIIKLIPKNSSRDINLRITTLICELRHIICECTIGMTGFEPAAPSSRTKCATKLRHIPPQKWHDKKILPQSAENNKLSLFHQQFSF